MKETYTSPHGLHTGYLGITARTKRELDECLAAFDQLQAEAPPNFGTLNCEVLRVPDAPSAALAVSCEGNVTRDEFTGLLAEITGRLREMHFPGVHCNVLDYEYSPSLSGGNPAAQTPICNGADIDMTHEHSNPDQQAPSPTAAMHDPLRATVDVVYPGLAEPECDFGPHDFGVGKPGWSFADTPAPSSDIPRWETLSCASSWMHMRESWAPDMSAEHQLDYPAICALLDYHAHSLPAMVLPTTNIATPGGLFRTLAEHVEWAQGMGFLQDGTAPGDVLGDVSMFSRMTGLVVEPPEDERLTSLLVRDGVCLVAGGEALAFHSAYYLDGFDMLEPLLPDDREYWLSMRVAADDMRVWGLTVGESIEFPRFDFQSVQYFEPSYDRYMDDYLAGGRDRELAEAVFNRRAQVIRSHTGLTAREARIAANDEYKNALGEYGIGRFFSEVKARRRMVSMKSFGWGL